MSGAYRDIKRTIELDAPLMTEHIGKMVQSDAQAHRFILTLTDGGEAASLSGYSVSGKFVNAYGQGVSMKGTISGNVVTAVLDEACYHVPGMAGGFIRVQNADASIIRTVMRFTADVESDGGDAAYDPNGVIGSIDEMLAKIAAMEAATADGLAAAQEARSAGAQAIADAQAAGEEAKATAQTAADDATAAAETARSTIYTRAVAIPDASALAASHELYAQKDYPLNVAVHGYTYQEGEGDPSPENVRPISGLDAAQVHAGGKNLFDHSKIYPGFTFKNGVISVLAGTGYAHDLYTNTAGNDTKVPEGYMEKLPYLAAGTYSFNYVSDSTVSLYSVDEDRTVHEYYNKKIITLPRDTRVTLRVVSRDAITISNIQIEPGSTATDYEPYLATTADLPLLPDGSPLMEGDAVENWVRSGCDVRKVISSADDLTLEGFDASANVVYSDTVAAITVADGVITTALTYPTTVYYRSTDYTPEKDLRVCRVVRKKGYIKLTGEETPSFITTNGPLQLNYNLPSYSANDNLEKCSHFKFSSSAATNNSFDVYSNAFYLRFDINEYPDIDHAVEYVTQQYAAGTPLTATYTLATPETYMTDPLPLLPPAALESDTVTVSGSGETEVTYAHEPKHYIDSQIAAAVALALNG